jgi:hypothetical protein
MGRDALVEQQPPEAPQAYHSSTTASNALKRFAPLAREAIKDPFTLIRVDKQNQNKE